MKPDGGPAFPRVCGEPIHDLDNGMSLRDWFAGQALAGMLTWAGQSGRDINAAEQRARYAYAHADAMLAERERQ